MPPLRPLLRFLLLLPLGIAAPDSGAIVSTPCESFSSFDPDGPTEPIVDQSDTPGSCASSVDSGSVFLNSDGEAGVGFFLARAEYNRVDDAPIDDAVTFTRTQFRDTIVLDSPGLAGQFVTIHAAAFLDGVIDVTGTGRASVRLDVLSNPGGSSMLVFQECRVGMSCFGSFDPYPRVVSEAVDVSFNVQVGASVTFGLSLTASAGHGGSLSAAAGSGLSEFGAGGTVGWGGITAVRHEGDAVPFTITSESGTDWTQPVPEPHGGLAGPGALLALRGVRARRSRLGRARLRPSG